MSSSGVTYSLLVMCRVDGMSSALSFWLTPYGVRVILLTRTKLRVQRLWTFSPTSLQCHLNKKNVAEALLFEGKALLPGSLAMERGISALDNARVKAEAAWGQQGGRFAQIGQESLLQPGDLLARDQGKLIAGGVQHLDGMREAETI